MVVTVGVELIRISLYKQSTPADSVVFVPVTHNRRFPRYSGQSDVQGKLFV